MSPHIACRNFFPPLTGSTDALARALTSLATFYIPLSFASSLLGMNVMQISACTTPLWVYFAIAVPLTVVSLLMVGNQTTVARAWNYFFKKDEYGLDSRWTRVRDFITNPRQTLKYWKDFGIQ